MITKEELIKNSNLTTDFFIAEKIKDLRIETKYKINADKSVDFFGDVTISAKKLTALPIKFGEIKGNFECDSNYLTTLENAPKIVHGDFYCNNNLLTTLKGCPNIVQGFFVCSDNELKNLEHCPEFVGGAFYAENNQIDTLEFLPKEVRQPIILKGNLVKDLTGLKPYIGDSGIILEKGNTFTKKDILFYFKKLEIEKLKINLTEELCDKTETNTKKLKL